MRVSPPRIFPAATHAARPPAEAAGAADAFRQARFVLGDELDTVLEILEAEAAVAQDASGAKYRKQVVAATLTAWSASWLNRLQALHAIEWGSYIPALTLLEAGLRAQRRALAHLQTGGAAWEEWVDGGISQDAAAHATAFALGDPAALDVNDAADELSTLGDALAAILGSPFGGAVLLTAADSSPDRIAPTFGDRDFHVGLAEIALGGLLLSGAAQLEALIAHDDRLPVADPDRLASLARRARSQLERRDRCRIEPLTGDEDGRYLVHNFRRASSAAPKRYLL